MFILLCTGFLLQTLGLNLRGMEVKGCPLGNSFEITQFICWSFVLLYFIIGPVFRLRLLGFFTAGLASGLSGIALLIPAWDRDYPPGIFGGNPWIELHAALAIFSYGVFALVALVSVMFLIQQHGLKKKQFKGIYAYLPSVQQLDTIAYRLLLTGVGCLIRRTPVWRSLLVSKQRPRASLQAQRHLPRLAGLPQRGRAAHTEQTRDTATRHHLNRTVSFRSGLTLAHRICPRSQRTPQLHRVADTS